MPVGICQTVVHFTVRSSAMSQVPIEDAASHDELQPPEAVVHPPSRLYLYVLIAIACGIAVGALKPAWGIELKPLGDAFVRLIKMLIAPIVFVTVTAGIAGMGDLKKVGRVGGKALIWFEFMTTLALILGLTLATLFKPGAGIHASVDKLDPTALNTTLAGHPQTGIIAHLLRLIPDTFVGAFAEGDLLQVLTLAVFTGIALSALGKRAARFTGYLGDAATALFAIVNVVMKLAPFGAFGAMAYTIGKNGVDLLGNLAELMLVFYATALLFVFVVLGLVVRLLGLNIFKLVRYLKEELVLVLGTSSSESALPALMAKLENLGCKPEIVQLVVPTGYSFNLDGTCIYLTLSSIFVAQALDIPLSMHDQVALLLILLLTSKGAAGVTGSGFITLAATLSSLGTIPVAGLTLILGIDRFMSEARALTNLVGNAVATLVVSRWERAFDLNHARETLNRRPGTSTQA